MKERIGSMDKQVGLWAVVVVKWSARLQANILPTELQPLIHYHFKQFATFKKMRHPWPLLFYFCLFKHTIQILQQIGMRENVHPVYSAGI